MLKEAQVAEVKHCRSEALREIKTLETADDVERDKSVKRAEHCALTFVEFVASSWINHPEATHPKPTSHH